MAANQPVSVLELLYPLMQAYDSVMVDADVELGGTDQLFNLMLAREVQADYGREPQVVLTMPILSGIDGAQKMSKSLGNQIGVADPPAEQFGRTMRISDDALPEWYRLLAPGEPPPAGPAVEDKRRLGRLIADRFHGDGAGADGRGPLQPHRPRPPGARRRCPRSCSTGTVRCTFPPSWPTGWGSPRAARRAG